MGEFSDLLEAGPSRFATVRSDSQEGPNTVHGRHRTLTDGTGRVSGVDSQDSRDSQSHRSERHTAPPETPSGGASRFATLRSDSQDGSHAARSRYGVQRDKAGRACAFDSQESHDSQAMNADMRKTLIAIAQAECVPFAVVDAINHADVSVCVGLPRATLAAYLRALHRSQQMVAGRVPAGWTHIVRCAGCGPVCLPRGMPGAVLACAWCHHRRVGRPIPNPTV